MKTTKFSITKISLSFVFFVWNIANYFLIFSSNFKNLAPDNFQFPFIIFTILLSIWFLISIINIFKKNHKLNLNFSLLFIILLLPNLLFLKPSKLSSNSFKRNLLSLDNFTLDEVTDYEKSLSLIIPKTEKKVMSTEEKYNFSRKLTSTKELLFYTNQLKDSTNYGKYLGKDFEIAGLFRADSSFIDNQIFVGRFVQLGAHGYKIDAIGFYVVFDKTPSVPPNKWIKVKGILTMGTTVDGEKPILKAESYEFIKAGNPYIVIGRN